ncbi:hypothetical protein ACFXKG_14155 [Streptomyces sp. NPDC059255]|uniref:hypothetical protein n=1 Tax=Streptomyces sp. NPDC059255 TaxID=3346793 RepID=UPI0036C0653E
MAAVVEAAGPAQGVRCVCACAEDSVGIESDQLVYDYLSRVGDAAQQQHLPSGDRMRLVSTLRNEIDKQRGKFGTDSPASVRRILGRLGEPHAVVRAAARDAGTGAARAPEAPEVAVPAQRTGLAKSLGLRGSKEPKGGSGGSGANGDSGTSGANGFGGRKTEPTPPPSSAPPELSQPSGPSGPSGWSSPSEARSAFPEPSPPSAPSGPEEAEAPFAVPPVIPLPAAPPQAPAGERPGNGPGNGPEDAAGPRIPAQASESPSASAPPTLRKPPRPAGRQPDWWRIEPGPSGLTGMSMEPTHGFVGGVEIPDMLKPPKPEEEAAEDDTGAAATDDPGAPEETAEGAPRRRRRLRLRPGPRKAKGGGGLSHPFLLLAAALLVASVFTDPRLALGGWLLAYVSRTLSRAEAKWVVFGLPGVSAAGGVVWLWGRMDERWGEAIPPDGLADALTGVWPVVLRTAAVSSALYLVWRARRKPAR